MKKIRQWIEQGFICGDGTYQSNAADGRHRNAFDALCHCVLWCAEQSQSALDSVRNLDKRISAIEHILDLDSASAVIERHGLEEQTGSEEAYEQAKKEMER